MLITTNFAFAKDAKLSGALQNLSCPFYDVISENLKNETKIYEINCGKTDHKKYVILCNILTCNALKSYTDVESK